MLVKFTAYVCAERIYEDEIRTYVLTFKPANELFGSLVLEKEIEIDVPDELLEESVLIAGKVAQLKLAKDKILADAHVQAKKIQDSIDKLTAIEHKE